jgi:hypothetical protein
MPVRPELPCISANGVSLYMAKAKETRVDESKEEQVPARWMFYAALALATVFALLAARMLGMPSGWGIEQEPQETGQPPNPTPDAKPP